MHVSGCTVSPTTPAPVPRIQGWQLVALQVHTAPELRPVAESPDTPPAPVRGAHQHPARAARLHTARCVVCSGMTVMPKCSVTNIANHACYWECRNWSASEHTESGSISDVTVRTIKWLWVVDQPSRHIGFHRECSVTDKPRQQECHLSSGYVLTSSKVLSNSQQNNQPLRRVIHCIAHV